MAPIRIITIEPRMRRADSGRSDLPQPVRD
jgi:hypothetical protein